MKHVLLGRCLMTFLRLTAAKKGFVAETHMTFVYLHHLPYLRSFYFCFLYCFFFCFLRGCCCCCFETGALQSMLRPRRAKGLLMMPLTSEVAKSQPAEVRKKPTERQPERERKREGNRERGRKREPQRQRASLPLCQPCLLFLLATYVIYWHFEHLPCVVSFPLPPPPTLCLAKISINQSHFIWLHNL